MKSLALDLTAESPLAIRADHAAGGAAGAKSIPGSTLLGSLASLYRMVYDGKDEMQAFAPLFLHEQVLFPSLFPALIIDKGLQDQPAPVYPLPITATSCKRHSGFHFPDDDKNDGHGARDTLFDWTLFKLASASPERYPQTQPLEILRSQRECRRCKQAMDHFEGYYRRNALSPYQLIAAESTTRLQTHTGIHRESGTVQDGILYNRQVFTEGTRFWGEALVPDDERLIEQFKDFVELVGTQGLLRMGTGRTRGMGKVRLHVRTPQKAESFSSFSERLTAFNQAFQARAADFQMATLPYAFFFALTLHSPLLLCDDFLRYQSCIDVPTLQQILHPCALPEELKLLYYASSMKRITGWQELWGTPRTGEYAIDSGSVFLFACQSPLDATCLKALFALEERGMGKRRAEGFGRVCVSDQFHQLVQQEAA